jgi:hypothetical protein
LKKLKLGYEWGWMLEVAVTILEISWQNEENHAKL